MVELALVLANSALSETVDVILLCVRVCARVETALLFLLDQATGKYADPSWAEEGTPPSGARTPSRDGREQASTYCASQASRRKRTGQRRDIFKKGKQGPRQQSQQYST